MVIVNPEKQEGFEAGEMPAPELLEAMEKFNENVFEAGVMIGGDVLHPTSKVTLVHFSGAGAKKTTSGPFQDTRNVIGGFWIWKVNSEEEAIEWANRAPMKDEE